MAGVISVLIVTLVIVFVIVNRDKLVLK